MPVEERQLLRTMRRIVGGIQINRHPISPVPQSLAVTPHYADRQGFAHPIEFFHSHPILETRQRRLGGQVVTFASRSNSNLCLLRLIATYLYRGTGGGCVGAATGAAIEAAMNQTSVTKRGAI